MREVSPKPLGALAVWRVGRVEAQGLLEQASTARLVAAQELPLHQIAGAIHHCQQAALQLAIERGHSPAADGGCGLAARRT